MIDFETAQKTFLDYVKKYELQDARIDLWC